MARELVETTFIAAAPEAVWELYDDLGLLSSWAPSVVEARLIDGGTRKHAGARVQVTLRMFGLTRTVEEEVVAHVPPRSCTIHGAEAGMRYWITLDLLPEGAGTRSYYRIRLEYSLPLKPVGALLDRLNRSMLRDGLGALRSAAERRA